MAARKRPFSPAKLSEMRDRISATLLMKRLEDHAVGIVEMTATQIRAAEILLKKCMPDLSAIEHSGEVAHRPAQEMTDDELSAIAAGSSAGTAAQAASTPSAPSVH